ncbi:MAG: cysteine-rich CWC family protein [Bacteroidetes bacterium]|nr:cysteine-rich CWC family protein [Bacteroidota bacterium]
MEKHALETCPLCGEPFVCKVNNIQKCDCSKINLNNEELEYIRKYLETSLGAYECVCVKCLNQLKSQLPQHLNEYFYKK